MDRSIKHEFIGFMDTEKNWLSTPLCVRKYHHLWNLLNRSCIYASTLLSLIEAKQTKRKRKLARLKKRRAKAKKLQISAIEVDIEKHVEKLLDELVDQVRIDVEIFGCNADESCLEASNVANCSSFSNDCGSNERSVLNATNDWENSVADSALGESGFMSENMATRVENEKVSDAADDSALLLEPYCDEEKISEILCDDEEYIKSLQQRHGIRSSSAQPENEKMTSSINESLTETKMEPKLETSASNRADNQNHSDLICTVEKSSMDFEIKVKLDDYNPKTVEPPAAAGCLHQDFNPESSKSDMSVIQAQTSHSKMSQSLQNADMKWSSIFKDENQFKNSPISDDNNRICSIKSDSEAVADSKTSNKASSACQSQKIDFSKEGFQIKPNLSNSDLSLFSTNSLRYKVSQSSEYCGVELNKTFRGSSQVNIVKETESSLLKLDFQCAENLEQLSQAGSLPCKQARSIFELLEGEFSLLPRSHVINRVSQCSENCNVELRQFFLSESKAKLFGESEIWQKDFECMEISDEYDSPFWNTLSSSLKQEQVLDDGDDCQKTVPSGEDKLAAAKCIQNLEDNVSCPICSKMVLTKTINKHLDICTGVETKINSLRNRSFAAHNQKVTKSIDSKKKENSPKAEKKIVFGEYPKNFDKSISTGKEDENRLQLRNKKTIIRPCDDKKEDYISDDQDDTDLVPTGIEKLKAALTSAIANNTAVKSLVVQTAAAEQNIDKKDAEKHMDEELLLKSPSSQALIQAFSKVSPIINVNLPAKKTTSKDKVNEKPRNLDEFDMSDSDEEEAENLSEEEIAVPALPTRRSSRSTRSTKSYREISSGDDDDYDYEEFKTKKIPPRKKKKVEVHISRNDTGVTSVDTLSSGYENANNTNNEGDMEEDVETSLSEAEIKELLKKKYYKPTDIDLRHITTDVNGSRYCDGMPIDPAQPKFFTGGVLREYQVTGYQWLKLLYENGESGILADEMGLGKTIQCIALMCKLFKAGVKGPFLICGPTSTINNWMSEFKKFAPKITLLLFHGTGAERRYLWNFVLDQINSGQQIVIVTSYEILLRDNAVFSAYSWAYLILDEGHRVKNLKSKTFSQLKSFPASCKLMLTGTPLQNNVSELWSLLNFIFPEVFDDVQVFETWFGIESLQTNKKLLSMLHQILTPFVLRRVKADVEVKIPPKREILVSVPLASLQDKFYRATVDKSISHLCKNKEYYNVTPGVANPNQLYWDPHQNDQGEGRWTRSKAYASKVQTSETEEVDSVINITLSNIMMQLRKCCNHPYLIQHPFELGTNQLIVDETLISTCGKMMLLDRMLPVLKENAHKVLLFSQMTSMLDLLEDYCNLREFEFVRFDGSTRCEDRYNFAYYNMNFIQIKKFNESPDIFIFLLSTRAGGLGINLTAADTVIIYDSDWNPQNDIQAQDRCHRIGQEKPVVTYRLVAMGTIDQQIVERAAMKRRLEKMIMHQEKFKGDLALELGRSETVTTAELLNLLEATVNISVVDNKENVISDENLQKLLDRSDMSRFKSSGDLDSQSISQSCQAATFQIIEETEEEKICV